MNACSHERGVAPIPERPSRPLAQCVTDIRAAPITPSERLSLPPQREMRSDEIDAVVARVVPGGWGGFARTDSAGRLGVRLVDTTQAGAALATLRRLAEDPAWASFPPWYGPMLPTARVVATQWSLAQLYDWKAYIDTQLAARQTSPPFRIRGAGIGFEGFIEYAATDSIAQERLDAYLGTLGLPCKLVRTTWMAPLFTR